MTRFLRPLMWLSPALAMGLAFSASAQTAAPAAAAQPAALEGARGPATSEPRVERIRHEDGLSRIDELRVGGQTRSIEVQPKNGAPGYQIAPQQAHESPGQRAAGAGTAGKSSWRILNF